MSDIIHSTRKGYLINNQLVNVGGIHYPVTHRFVVGGYEEFDGDILECYNATASIIHESEDNTWDFTYSTLNFTATSQRHNWLLSGTNLYNHDSIVQDYFGIIFTHEENNEVHNIWMNLLLTQGQAAAVAYQAQHMGAKGIVVAADGSSDSFRVFINNFMGQARWYPAHQPTIHKAENRKVVTINGSSSGSGAYSIKAIVVVGPSNLTPISRSKDKVTWFYNTPSNNFFGNPNSGFSHMKVDNSLFLPGQIGYKRISNKYKYAPWERYPNL